MATVTGFTANRMQQIEDETVVSGEVIGDDLYLERRDGVQFNAGNVRGPAGVGTTPAGPAGGSLSGSYPNPGLADNAVTSSKILNGAVTAAKLSSDAQNRLIPTGTVLPYAGGSAPSGFLLLSGQAVSRATYAALFAVLGTSFGAGDGSSTFNLPNPQDRVLMGASGSKALGSIGGAATAVLTSANLPPHTHDMTHAHGSQSDGTDGGSTLSFRRASNTNTSTGGGMVQQYTGNTGSGPGSSSPVDILNPYQAMNFIIKT